jgi:hypothetical protein
LDGRRQARHKIRDAHYKFSVQLSDSRAMRWAEGTIVATRRRTGT